MLQLIRRLLLGVVLVGCGRSGEAPNDSRADQLRNLTQVRLAEYAAAADPTTGWPEPWSCDGVLHAGIAKAAGIPGVDLSLAEQAPGRIGRRAVGYPECWNEAEGDVGAKATTSSDMAMGYVWGLWRSGDLAGLQSFADYGEAHSVKILGLEAWIIGEPYPSQRERVLLRPGLVGLVGQAIAALSKGQDLRAGRHQGQLYSPWGEDFQDRLTVLGILLGGEATGTVSPGQYLVLQDLAHDWPDDPLFQAAYARYSGNWAPAYAALLHPDLQCPSYNRGIPANCLANWLFAASLVEEPARPSLANALDFVRGVVPSPVWASKGRPYSLRASLGLRTFHEVKGRRPDSLRLVQLATSLACYSSSSVSHTSESLSSTPVFVPQITHQNRGASRDA